MKYPKILTVFAFCFLFLTFLSGCALVIQKGRRSDLDKISALEQELAELRSARSSLERKLFKEIEDKQVKLEMKDKGLVITVLAEVLFDSGKAQLRKESLPILAKVAGILKGQLKNHQIGVEGHTDNVPIKYSKWDSNWDLSSNRALSVLHYMEEQGVAAKRLSGMFYGEYNPVASNSDKQGRQLNRRVEIVVLPRLVKELDIKEAPEEELLK